MAIETVAGESATANVAGQVDVGPGAMSGDDSFTLPTDFEQNIDDGIELVEDQQLSTDGTGAPITPAPPGAPGSQQGQTGQTPLVQQQTPASVAGQQPATQQTPAQTPPAQPPAAQPQAGDRAGASEPRIYSPAELATQLHTNRGALIDALAQQKFALTPQEIQALEVDAVGVLPKMMARVYLEATVNGLQQLANMVPRMVESVVTTRIGENSAEEAFHTEWPNIDRQNPQQMQAVEHFSRSFRQMQPNASQADAIKFVGTAVTNFFNLQMPQRANGNGSQRGATPPRRPTPPAFAPATGGRAAPLPGQTTAPVEAFGGLGMQFDEG